MNKKYFSLLATVLLCLLFAPCLQAQKYRTLNIKPSTTDASILNWDFPHLIRYDPTLRHSKVLLWLPGTTGTTERLPNPFLNTALESGYKIVALSVISSPGISQVCIGNNLQQNSNCAYDFRRYRIYGDDIFPLIEDQPQDAIVNRLSKLFIYLIKEDPDGNWEQYFDTKTEKIKWEEIAIAGQSQGGGMAQFIGQHENVARVISFSGGWDYRDAKTRTIADWYSRPCVTPASKWFAVYHVKEARADVLVKICHTLPIPKDQVFALEEPLQPVAVPRGPNPFHGQGLGNIVYKPVWKAMLGSGLD